MLPSKEPPPQRKDLDARDPRCSQAFATVLPRLKRKSIDVTAVPTSIIGQLQDARILVTDDDPSIRTVIQDMLESQGAVVEAAENGDETLSKLTSFTPDLLILDVMLPGESGFEIAKKAKDLHRSQGLKTAPRILMLTALSSSDALPEGMSAGADDFLSKPFRHLELLTRAAGLVRTKRTMDRLAHLLESREEFAGTIVHDLRTPLAAILMNASVLSRLTPAEDAPIVEDITQAAREISGLLDDMLLAARAEASELIANRAPTNVRSLVEGAANRASRIAGSEKLTVVTRVDAGPETEMVFPLDEKLMIRVLDNLLGNAVKYGGVPGSEVTLEAAITDEGLLISVMDQGPGVPEEWRASIFERYTRIESGGSGFGIGLAFCKSVIEAHAGRIWVEEAPSGGAAFKVLCADAATT